MTRVPTRSAARPSDLAVVLATAMAQQRGAVMRWASADEVANRLGCSRLEGEFPHPSEIGETQ